MITEPEMADASGPGRSADVIGDDRPPPSGGPGPRRPWLWALGAAVATSAVWAGALQVAHHARAGSPDLHGYHLVKTPCAPDNLRPLTGDLGPGPLAAGPEESHTGPGLDHSSCTLNGRTPTGDGWVTTYSVTFSVDLHEKTDPGAEFEDAVRLRSDPVLTSGDGSAITFSGSRDVVGPYPGLGDRAYLTSGASRQALDVLHGGAVLSLSVDGVTKWQGRRPPTSADGFPAAPRDDISAIRRDLPGTMRRLMALLSAPPSAT